MKAIIIYCSLTGRTKLVAEIIAGELSNYEVEVEPIIYTKGKRPNYKEEEEKIANGDLSSFEFSKRIFDLNPYDLVCIGMPTWGGRPALIFRGYAEKCNTFEGKAVVVFNTCRFLSYHTIPEMKAAIEEKGGKIVAEKTFKKLYSMDKKKPKVFGQELNQYRP